MARLQQKKVAAKAAPPAPVVQEALRKQATVRRHHRYAEAGALLPVQRLRQRHDQRERRDCTLLLHERVERTAQRPSAACGLRGNGGGL